MMMMAAWAAWVPLAATLKAGLAVLPTDGMPTLPARRQPRWNGTRSLQSGGVVKVGGAEAVDVVVVAVDPVVCCHPVYVMEARDRELGEDEGAAFTSLDADAVAAEKSEQVTPSRDHSEEEPVSFEKENSEESSLQLNAVSPNTPGRHQIHGKAHTSSPRVTSSRWPTWRGSALGLERDEA